MKLLIAESPLQVLPTLARKIGLNEAIVLQQLHYLLEWKRARKLDERDGVTWVYNTYEDWKRDHFPFWSIRTLKRVFANLEEMGLVRAANYNRMGIDRTKWYAIDYARLEEIEATELLPSDENERPSGQDGTMDGSDWHDQLPKSTSKEEDIPLGADLPEGGTMGETDSLAPTEPSGTKLRQVPAAVAARRRVLRAAATFEERRAKKPSLGGDAPEAGVSDPRAARGVLETEIATNIASVLVGESLSVEAFRDMPASTRKSYEWTARALVGDILDGKLKRADVERAFLYLLSPAGQAKYRDKRFNCTAHTVVRDIGEWIQKEGRVQAARSRSENWLEQSTARTRQLIGG